MRQISSFRDPNGYVAEIGGELYRYIHPDAYDTFSQYIASGLHAKLVTDRLIVDHVDLGSKFPHAPLGWKTIKPKKISRINYASEWCFSQLRDAALLTLEIQIIALQKGFSLKDASSFNVHFDGNSPIFIDTLSFDLSIGEEPWTAYRQFCEHFLAPLALMTYSNADVSSLWNAQIGGVPLSLTNSLLPIKSWFNWGLLIHIYFHSQSNKLINEFNSQNTHNKIRPQKGFQLQLAKSLKSVVLSLKKPQQTSNWVDYRQKNTYSISDSEIKLKFVTEVISQVNALYIMELGSNDGFYSKKLSLLGLKCTATEREISCCDLLYNETKNKDGLSNLLVLHVDHCNPTPSFGLAGEERSSFSERYKCDLVLALALIHHLSIGENIPYENIAKSFSILANNLIVEFIPPNDVMSQNLLMRRPSLRKNSSALFGMKSFEENFTKYFEIIQKSVEIAGGRFLYQMKLKNENSL